MRQIALVLGLSAGALAQAQARTDSPPALYQTHCASCHGVQRLGAMGPALLPESLARLRRASAQQVIAQGRAATQMPGFADKLDDAQIAQLTQWI
ncbi:MAG: cytochrome c, partial [Hylemonella sp.]|nr:cytochrome c [Hylemonella sp.]